MALCFFKYLKNSVLTVSLVMLSFISTAQNSADVVQNYGEGIPTGLNNRVNDIKLQSDGKAIIGGYFDTYYGMSAKRIVRVNVDGTQDASFNIGAGFTGYVYSIALQPNGKIIVGGDFSAYKGTSENGIIRLNPDGTKDVSFNTGIGFAGMVKSIVVQPDGKIIVGGSLSSYNGVTIYNFIRLNSNGSIDTSFDTGTGFNYSIGEIVLLSDSKIIVGGGFTSYKGITEKYLIRLNSNGTKDASFNTGTGFDNTVTAIAPQADGKMIVCGVFTLYNGIAENYIVRLNSNGTKDTSFNTGSGFNGISYSVKLQPDGKIVIGGNFETYNNLMANRIICLNANGTKDASFDVGQGFNLPVISIVIQPDGNIILGGDFGLYKNNIENKIIRLNTNGNKDASFNTGNIGEGFNHIIRDVVLEEDGKMIVGGNFSMYKNITENRIIRLNANGTKDTSFNTGTGFNNNVHAVVLQPDGKIIVGGNFSSYNETARNRLIRLNTDGMIDTSFNIGTGFFWGVNAIVIQGDGKIIVGGSFMSFNGTTQNRIVRLNPDGTKDTTFDTGSGFNNDVFTITLQPDGKIIVGGVFTNYKGIYQNRIIRLNPDGTKDTSFNIGYGFDSGVYDIVCKSDGKIIVAGSFYMYNASYQKCMVLLNNDGTKDTSFSIGTGFNNIVKTIALKADGKMIVGGLFTSYKGLPENGIICLNPDGTKESSFNVGTGFNDDVNVIALQPNGKITVGGVFSSYNGSTDSARLITLNGDFLLSIEDFKTDKTIFLWPNPVQNVLNISNLDGLVESLEIYNLQGKLIYENENTTVVDVSHFASGLYIAHLKTNTNTFTKKFIKL